MAFRRTIGIALALLLVGTGLGVASAEPNDVDDHVRLETGSTAEWGGGDYVALNMTQNGTLAFFGVVYGTEENPNAILILSAYVQFLGGAELRDEHGGIMGHTGIPVLTVHAQALAFLVEFNDTGYPSASGRVGAGNGLFDFTRTGSGVEDFDLTAVEPVYKAVDLRRAWERSAVEESPTPAAEHQKEWTFSLRATDVPYTRVWDEGPAEHEDGSRNGTAADGAVETIEFRFRVGAAVTPANVQVPWYRVTVDGENRVVASQESGKRQFKGVGLDADFKYDHVLKGWDFTAQSETSRLMLETFVAFGTFVPDFTQGWVDAAFGAGYLDSYSVAEVETYTGDPRDIAGVDDLPSEATLLSKDAIAFRDGSRKSGEMSWVTGVEVDGRPEQMVYQIHAGDVDWDQRGENDDGTFHGAVLLGGYIYPAGADLYHDPAFSTSAVLVSLPTAFWLPALLIAAAVAAAVAVIAVIGVARLHGRRSEVRLPPNYGAF